MEIEQYCLGQPKWVATVIDNGLRPLTVALRLQDNTVLKRHQDHYFERETTDRFDGKTSGE